MPFEKGHTGRPRNTHNKHVFNLCTIINNRFPAREIYRTQKLEALQSAMSSKGKALLIRYLNGEQLTARQTILAQCCECMGYYADGKVDCENPLCSNYQFMPYRPK